MYLKRITIAALASLALAAPASAQTTELPRTGAVCMDGTQSTATGAGACSSHGGVSRWLYDLSQPQAKIYPNCTDGIDNDADGNVDMADIDVYLPNGYDATTGTVIAQQDCDEFNLTPAAVATAAAPVAEPAPSTTLSRAQTLSKARKLLSKRFKSYRHGTGRKLTIVSAHRVRATWHYHGHRYVKTVNVREGS